VIDVNHDTNRMVVSLKPRMCGVPTGTTGTNTGTTGNTGEEEDVATSSAFFNAYLANRHRADAVKGMIARGGSDGGSDGGSEDGSDGGSEYDGEDATMVRLNALEIGSVVSASITHKRDYGVILDIQGSVGFCLLNNVGSGKKFKVGKVIDVVVLDVDTEKVRAWEKVVAACADLCRLVC
jgi:hypothetical protein